MRARRHPGCSLRGRQARANRKTAAKRFCQRHHIRRHAETFIGEQFAGAAHAGLHLVEYQQQAFVIAKLSQGPKECRRCGTHAALSLQRLDQDAGRRWADRFLHSLEVAERYLVEAIHWRAKTL